MYEGNTHMPATQQVREQRVNLWEQMQAVMARRDPTTGNLNSEDAEQYDRLDAELDNLDVIIQREERFDNRTSSYEGGLDRSGVVAPADTPDARDEDYNRAFNSMLRAYNGINDLEPEDRKLLQQSFRTFENAAGVGTPSAGGYAVPPGFRDVFVETMKWYGPMLDLAEIIRTDSGANLQWPTNDDTGNVGAILAENTQVTEQDVALGTASLDAYMYTSKMVRVSFQLLNDKTDFDTWLARKLGERVGRILNAHFTTGTGTAQPDGIVTSATVGVTGTGSLATTGGVGYLDAVNLLESLDPAYGNAQGGVGNGSGLTWMMHQTARRAFRRLLDTTGRPVWEPSIQVGVPDSLMGYPVRINNDMATVANNSKSILFGNIAQAYVGRIVNDLSLIRMNERFADFLQVAFLAYERADGTMQDANAVRVFQTTPTA
jgi:HK97 family phage major capsid protein